MTPSEQKIYDALMDIKTEIAVFAVKHESMDERMEKAEGHIETHKADRNKFLGVAWFGGILGGTGFFSGLGALIYTWFTKHS